MSSELFNSLVYPINGKIKLDFKLEDLNFLDSMYSETVKMGSCEMQLILRISKSGNLEAVISNSSYSYSFGGFITFNVTFLLKNRILKSKNCLELKCFSEYFELISIEELETLENSKNLEFIAEISIIFEKIPRRTKNFYKDIPSREDIRRIYRDPDFQKIKISKDVDLNLAEIPEDNMEIELFEVDRVPFHLSIRRDSKRNQLWWNLICNKSDKSDFWGIEFSAKFWNQKTGRLLNILNPSVFYNICTSTAYSTEEIGNLEEMENGIFELKIELEISDKWGFDEETGRGIDETLELMTDGEIKFQWNTVKVSKAILSYQSSFFEKLFFKPYLFEIPYLIDNVDEDLMDQFLLLAHNCDVIIDDVDKLLNLLKRFEAFECIRRLNLTADSENSEVSESESETLKFSEKNKFSDVELEVDGKKFHVSKQILSNSSVFFMKHFYRRYRKMKNEKLPEISAENFEILLKFIYYPSTLKIDDKNYEVLLEMGDKFQVDRLMDEVEKFLILSQNLELEEKKRIAEKYEEMVYLKSFCENQER